jgi:hypothetical protein
MPSTNESGIAPEELRKFTQAGRTIAAAVGASVELWARAEAGVILKTWAGRTPVATAAKTRLRAQKHALKDLGLTGAGGSLVPVTINAGIRGPFGRTFLRTTDGHWRRTHDAGFQPVPGMPNLSRKKRGDHYATSNWLILKSAIAEARRATAQATRRALASIGLGRQSIIQIADDLGIDLATVKGGGTLSAAGIAKARAALASNGTLYKNGLGHQQKSATEFFVELINRYPKLGRTAMDSTLAGVIRGRLKYFQKNLEEGTFLSARRAARAYPYIEVLRLAA